MPHVGTIICRLLVRFGLVQNRQAEYNVDIIKDRVMILLALDADGTEMKEHAAKL